MGSISKPVFCNESEQINYLSEGKISAMGYAYENAKMFLAMRYTPYTGLAQVTNWVRLKFATMNLKKLAKWKWKANNTPSKLLDFIVFLIKPKKNPIFA